jgi:hypothetical protein
MTMNYKNIIVSNLIPLFSASISAHNVSEMRGFYKTVAVGEETSLEVSNKYGSIQITQWNKDSVSIRAEIKAFAPNQSKLNKMFEGVTVNITDTKYLVRAQTDFTQNISMLFESFKGMTSKLISYDSRVEINYFINVPVYLNLNIENKYGDVYMESSTGICTVSVSNGSFKANSLGKSASVTLAFCDATINSLSSGKISPSFSEISIGEAGDIAVNSISSKIDIRKAEAIRLESRRDKLFLGDIDRLEGNSYFTDYKVNNLKEKMNLTAKYGNLDVGNIDKRFNEIDINSSYSDISLEFEEGSSYNVDIRYVNAFLVLPDRDAKTEKKALNDDKKEYMTFGTIGKNPGSAKLKIDATRGNIYIK